MLGNGNSRLQTPARGRNVFAMSRGEEQAESTRGALRAPMGYQTPAHGMTGTRSVSESLGRLSQLSESEPSFTPAPAWSELRSRGFVKATPKTPAIPRMSLTAKRNRGNELSYGSISRMEPIPENEPTYDERDQSVEMFDERGAPLTVEHLEWERHQHQKDFELLAEEMRKLHKQNQEMASKLAMNNRAMQSCNSTDDRAMHMMRSQAMVPMPHDVSMASSANHRKSNLNEMSQGYHGVGTPTRAFIAEKVAEELKRQGGNVADYEARQAKGEKPVSRELNFHEDGDISVDEIFGGASAARKNDQGVYIGIPVESSKGEKTRHFDIADKDAVDDKEKIYVRARTMQADEAERQFREDKKDLQARVDEYNRDLPDLIEKRNKIIEKREQMIAEYQEKKLELSKETLDQVAGVIPVLPDPPVDDDKPPKLGPNDYVPTEKADDEGNHVGPGHDVNYVPQPRISKSWPDAKNKLLHYNPPPAMSEIQDFPLWNPPSLNPFTEENVQYRKDYIQESKVTQLFNGAMGMLSGVRLMAEKWATSSESLAVSMKDLAQVQAQAKREPITLQIDGSSTNGGKDTKSKPWYKDVKMSYFPRLKIGAQAANNVITRTQSLLAWSLASEEWFALNIAQGRDVYRAFEESARTMYRMWLEAEPRQRTSLSYGWKAEEERSEEEERAWETVYAHIANALPDAIARAARELIKREEAIFQDDPVWRTSMLFYVTLRTFGFRKSAEVTECINFCKNPKIMFNSRTMSVTEQIGVWKRLTVQVASLGVESEEGILRIAMPIVVNNMIDFFKTSGDAIQLNEAIQCYNQNKLRSFSTPTPLLYQALEEVESLFADDTFTTTEALQLPNADGNFGGGQKFRSGQTGGNSRDNRNAPYRNNARGQTTKMACLDHVLQIPHDEEACAAAGYSHEPDAVAPCQWQRKMHMLARKAGIDMIPLSNFYTSADDGVPVNIDGTVYLSDLTEPMPGESFKARVNHGKGKGKGLIDRQPIQKTADTPACLWFQNGKCMYVAEFCKFMHQCYNCGSTDHALKDCVKLTERERVEAIEKLAKNNTKSAHLTCQPCIDIDEDQRVKDELAEGLRKMEKTIAATKLTVSNNPHLNAADIPVKEPTGGSWDELDSFAFSDSFITQFDVEGFDDSKLESLCNQMHQKAPPFKLGPDGSALYQAAQQLPVSVTKKGVTSDMLMTDQGANGLLLHQDDCRLRFISEETTEVSTTNGTVSLRKGMARIPLINSCATGGKEPPESVLHDVTKWSLVPTAVTTLRLNIVPLFWFGCLGRNVGWTSGRFQIVDAYGYELPVVERNQLFFLPNGVVFRSDVQKDREGRVVLPWHREYAHENYEPRPDTAMALRARWQKVQRELSSDAVNITDYKAIHGTSIGVFVTKAGPSFLNNAKIVDLSALIAQGSNKLMFGKHIGKTFAQVYVSEIARHERTNYLTWRASRFHKDEPERNNDEDEFDYWARNILMHRNRGTKIEFDDADDEEEFHDADSEEQSNGEDDTTIEVKISKNNNKKGDVAIEGMVEEITKRLRDVGIHKKKASIGEIVEKVVNKVVKQTKEKPAVTFKISR